MLTWNFSKQVDRDFEMYFMSLAHLVLDYFTLLRCLIDLKNQKSSTSLWEWFS